MRFLPSIITYMFIISAQFPSEQNTGHWNLLFLWVLLSCSVTLPNSLLVILLLILEARSWSYNLKVNWQFFDTLWCELNWGSRQSWICSSSFKPKSPQGGEDVRSTSALWSHPVKMIFFPSWRTSHCLYIWRLSQQLVNWLYFHYHISLLTVRHL